MLDPMARVVPQVVTCTVVLLALGCGKSRTKYDVYLEGLQIEGTAERTVCQPGFDAATGTQTLSADRIKDCLREQEAALTLYEEAGRLGMADDPEYQQTLTRAQERRARLNEMLAQVRRMEQEALPTK
jgi:hypothetical protein